MHHQRNRGVSLIEVLIAVSILVIFTTAFFIGYRGFNQTIFLNSLAYDVALTFRQAQVFSISAVESPNAIPGQEFDVPFGVHFDDSHDGAYILFSDDNKNGKYDDGGMGPFCSGECITEFSLKPNFSIVEFCATPPLSAPVQCKSTGLVYLDISFERPDPDAIIKTDLGSDYESAEITIQSPDGVTQRRISILNTGQISVPQ